jgi:lipopolysaccharide export system permease protein
MVASIVYGLSSFVLMYVSPWGFQGLHRLFFDVARSRAHYHLQAREFNDTFKGLVLYVERIRPEVQLLEGIFIAETRAAFSQVITAREGEILVQPEALRVVLRLHQGAVHRYVPAQKRYHLLRFGQYDMRLDVDTPLARQADTRVRARELFPAQLWAEIEHRQAQGKGTQRLLLYWHKLFALPFACIIFAGLGPALGIIHTRSGRAAGYVLGLGCIFIYYLFLMASDALGEETTFPPLLAAWLPNLCMAGITVLLLRRAAWGVPQYDVAWLVGWPRRFWQCWRGRGGPETSRRG